MEGIETNVKKYITSLLTSTPLVVTLQQLNKDYRNTIGEPIPYQKLGYNSLEHFLLSIPDTVQLKGAGPNSVVTPIITEKSAHVNKLVTNQKVVTKNRYGCAQKRARTVYPPQYKYSVNPPKPVINEPLPLSQKKMYYPLKKEVPSSLAYSSQSTPSCNNNYQPDNVVKYSEEPPNNNKVPTFKYPVKNDFKKPIKETNLFGCTRHSVDTNKLEETENYSPLTTNAKRIKAKKIHNDLDRVSEDHLENSVPFQVRNNLRTLIKSCPEGIWCAEVPEKYRKMFRSTLDYHDLGFKSLIHMCVCLSSIFHYVRPAMDDYKLYDRSRPLPDCAEKTYTMASYGTSFNRRILPETDNDNSALPALDWNDVKKFLPPDIYMPEEEMPRAFVSHDVKENDTIDVTVGEVYDLSKFWVHKTDSKLDELMDEMQEFYKKHGREYLIPDHLIREGLYCVQVIFGEYHRAFIVDTMPELEDTIRVVYIDYGTMTKVSTKGLCFLHVQFSTLEAQAIRCRLANVCPVEEGAPWSREASKAFRRLLAGRDVTAKINHINWEEQFLEVYLADITNEDDIFYINDKLVEEGFAQQPDKERKQTFVDPIYTPIVKFIHLFPTFLELEHGLAPSTVEMEIFQECDLPINFCYPQYFFVDHSREEKIIEAAEAFHEKNCAKDRRRTVTSRYFDLDQYKSRKLDLSVFGDLRQEIAEFLEMSTGEEERREDSDEDFVDAEEPTDEREADRRVKLEEVDAKDSDAIKSLQEDLLAAENIISKICKEESQETSPLDEDGSGLSESPVDRLSHPLSVMTFGEDVLEMPRCELQLPDVRLDQNTLSILNRLKIETDWKINKFINNELFSDAENISDKEDYYYEENAQNKEDNGYHREEATRYKRDNCSLIEEKCRYKENSGDLGEEKTLYKEDRYDLGEGKSWYKEDNGHHREEAARYKRDNCSLREEKCRYKEDSCYLGEEKSRYKEDNDYPREEKSQHKEDNGYLGKEKTRYKEDSDYPKEEKSRYKKDNYSREEKSQYKEDNGYPREEKTKCKEDIVQCREENIAWKSTNPFLEDLATDTDGQTEIARLNPNNPFLTYRSQEEETGSGSSGESSASTAYESPLVAKNSWSNFSDMSPDTISELGKSLRSHSNSSDSLRTQEDQASCSTQDVNRRTAGIQTLTEGNGQFARAYPGWPDMRYNVNSYYSMQLANFQSFVYESQYPAVANVLPPGVAPPPGFYPSCYTPNVFPAAPQFARPPFVRPMPAGFYGAMNAGGLYAMRRGDVPPRVNPASFRSGMAPLNAKSAVPPAASISQCDGVAPVGKDFYEVYNERLMGRKEDGHD